MKTTKPVGIIGSGAIGSAFARALSRAGIPALLSNSRGPESLTQLVEELGSHARAVTREEAAAQPIVLVAVPWSQLNSALAGLPHFEGRLVLDANNPIEAPLFEEVDLQGRLSTEVFTALVPGARVVKAFNHVRPQALAEVPDSSRGRRTLFYTGDDASARAEVGKLMNQLGFLGVDLGPLARGAALTQFPGGPLTNLELLSIHPAAEVEPDYDSLLRANLERVFNERDDARRLSAIEELFVAEPVMYEPAGVVNGRAHISQVAGKLLEQFGPTFRFTPEAPAVGHHGLGVLRWHAGPPEGPVAVRGSDAAEVRDGKIARLWVLLEEA